MARLVRIKISGIHNTVEIIMDWDNDRHQAVPIGGVQEPENVIAALRRAAKLLEKEADLGNI